MTDSPEVAPAEAMKVPTTAQEADDIAYMGAEAAARIAQRDAEAKQRIMAINEQLRQDNAEDMAVLERSVALLEAAVEDPSFWLTIANKKPSGEVVLNHLRYLRRRVVDQTLIPVLDVDAVIKRILNRRRYWRYGMLKKHVSYTLVTQAFVEHPVVARDLGVQTVWADGQITLIPTDSQITAVPQPDTVKLDLLPRVKQGTKPPKAVHSSSIKVPRIKD